MAKETALIDDNGKTTLIGRAMVSGEIRNPIVDDLSNASVSIDINHAKIHAGTHYQYTDIVTLASSASQDYMFTVASSKPAHLTFNVQGTAQTTVSLYEATDKTGTTLQTVYNNNRNSSTVASTTLHKGVSGGTTDGTLIFSIQGGTATGAFSQVSSSRNENEYILKLNTKYILRITSGANGNVISSVINWYENN